MDEDYRRENWCWRAAPRGARARRDLRHRRRPGRRRGPPALPRLGRLARFFDACGDDPVIEEIERLLELLDAPQRRPPDRAVPAGSSPTPWPGWSATGCAGTCSSCASTATTRASTSSSAAWCATSRLQGFDAAPGPRRRPEEPRDVRRRGRALHLHPLGLLPLGSPRSLSGARQRRRARRARPDPMLGGDARRRRRRCRRARTREPARRVARGVDQRSCARRGTGAAPRASAGRIDAPARRAARATRPARSLTRRSARRRPSRSSACRRCDPRGRARATRRRGAGAATCDRAT